jgi:hypothetical protein
MKDKSSEKPTRSSPKDKSLEAYKVWIQELARRFTTQKYEVDLTDGEWVVSWKEYWREKSTGFSGTRHR